MLSPKAKRNIYRIVPFGIIWMVFSIVYTLLEKGILGSLKYYPLTGNPYTFNRNRQVWEYVWLFFSDYAVLIVGLFMATVIVVTQFYTEVSENIGLGVLNNFFTGKYHSPTEEERIFMFLDMKSSTTIAESLGHERKG